MAKKSKTKDLETLLLEKHPTWDEIMDFIAEDNKVKEDKFYAVIEISKGSKNKYELEKETGMLVLDRVLHTSMVYPTNYGFIPRTYSEDNDPLDVLVFCSEKIEPLALVNCKPIGVLYMIDGGEKDEKILAVPKKDPFFNKVNDVSELPSHYIDEIKHFFAAYKALENKETEVKNVEGADTAKSVIKKALENYKNKFGCNN